MEHNELKANIHSALDRLHISRKARFLPASHFSGDEWRSKSINWQTAIVVNGRDVLTCTYSEGVGHLPNYSASEACTVDGAQRVADAIERGEWSQVNRLPRKLSPPDLTDIMHSIVSDCEAIDHVSFEDWASACGYDTDSRKAESIYHTCLKNTLALRAAIGDAALQELRELFQDY